MGAGERNGEDQGYGVMTSTQFRAALAELNLTQAEAARFLGISLRTSHSYANGYSIPPSTAMLLRLMKKHGIKPHEVPKA